ncbi:MAG: transposase, partial [Proteobacteria bacterium]|nr:transposase [Pseudomonadota bacterium]
MLHGGGRSLEDTRKIKKDKGLRKVLSLKKLPSPDAIGNWLRRVGKRGGLEGLLRVNRKYLECGMKSDGIDGYTLDIDATGIKSEKFYANMTYKDYKGYMPIVGHIAENGMVLGDEFREGNDSPLARNLEFIKHCEAQLPRGKRIKYFRSDSAGYQGKIIDYCFDNEIEFAIGADLDSAVVEL